MPSPVEGNPPHFYRGDEQGEPVSVTGGADDPVLAHVFKVTIDNFVGRLSVFRIHQGTMTKDSQVFADDARKPFKVSHGPTSFLTRTPKSHKEVLTRSHYDSYDFPRSHNIAYKV